MIQIVIKNSLPDDRTRRSLAQANLPLTAKGGNYLLNKMVLLVINISLIGDPNTLIFNTEKFTARMSGGNYLLNDFINYDSSGRPISHQGSFYYYQYHLVQ
jgi:hypothetical protein